MKKIVAAIIIFVAICVVCFCCATCATANNKANAEDGVHLQAQVIDRGYTRIIYGTKYDGVQSAITRIALLKVLNSDKYTYIDVVCDAETYGRLAELNDNAIVEVTGYFSKEYGYYPDYMVWKIEI